ncbi:hypothetical protein B0I37DRAFT_431713 [Chaetomium sp. MPI-CAGE-AT-0009]|nr:hypothetical protein B0I37DRAFT_431713 [Chaetomium sp. MPI-CAGE-AT-0009]
MSFPPISLAVYFPPELEPKAERGSKPSEVEPSAMEQGKFCLFLINKRRCLALVTTLACLNALEPLSTSHCHANIWRDFLELNPAADFPTHAYPSLSLATGIDKEGSSEVWDTNANTFRGRGEEEEGYWEEEGDEVEGEDAESGGHDSEQDTSGLSQGPQHVWLSDEERLRVAFTRARTSAEKVDLDRSPFFPRTLAEYAGLKAGMLEAKTARLRVKIEEKEMTLRARDRARWKRVFVVGRSGEAEEKVIPVYYGSPKEGKPAAPSAAKHSPMGADAASVVQGEATSNTNLENHWGGRIAPAPNATDHWVQSLYFAFPTTFDWFNFDAGHLISYEPIPSQAHQGLESVPCTGQLWPDSQLDGTVDHPPGSVPHHHREVGHQRTRSVAILREVAAHAAFRHGNISGNTQGRTDGAYHKQRWLEDDDYDSDSSFTPTDYRPRHGMGKGKEAREKAADATWCSHDVTGNFFTPDSSTNDLTITAEVENMGTDRDEEHFVFEPNGRERAGSERTECYDGAGLTQSDDMLDKLGFNGTLAGKMGADGKGKEEGDVKDDQLHVQKGDAHAREEESGNGSDTEDDNAQRWQVAEDKSQLNEPSPHPRASTPSAASTFTPSDYDPRKLNQHTPSPNNSTAPLPPPSPPQLATGPISHRDGLSPFFAHATNPFTPRPGPGPPACDCDWPTVAELTSEGEGRIKRWDTTTSTTATTTPQSTSSHLSHPSNADLNFNPNPDTAYLPPFTITTTTLNLNPTPNPTPFPSSLPHPNLGRFLPIPRLRNTIDPRLGPEYAPPPSEAEALALPWEVRAMAGERRWDLHAGRHMWEVWGWRFEDEEDGWDWLGEGESVLLVGLNRKVRHHQALNRRDNGL